MKRIDEDIKQGKFQTVYLLYGEERYLKRQYKQKLIRAMVAEGDTMNFAAYSGSDIPMSEIISLAQTLPFFAERRVILVEESGLFKAARGGSDGAANGDAGASGGAQELLEYLPQIPPTCCLLFVEPDVDKRLKLYKQVNKLGRAVSFPRQKEDILKRWIIGRLKKEGKAMAEDAVLHFLAKAGNDMDHIDQELEKLVSYCMGQGKIGIEEVDAICVEQTTDKIFEMIDAIVGKNQARAMDLYYDLLALKEAPLKILSLLMRQYRILMLVKEASGRGMDSQAIASRAGIPPFTVGKNRSLAAKLSMGQIREALELGADLEERAKSGKANDRIAVELLIATYSRPAPVAGERRR